MVKRVLGAASIGGSNSGIETEERLNHVLKVLQDNNIDEIDSARIYTKGESEKLLGQVSAHKKFKISTKVPSFQPGSGKKELILKSFKDSTEALKQDSVDIYYLHAPDRETSFEEQAEAMNEVHKNGGFKRLGLSNYTAEEVEKFYNICKKEGYVLPEVYQGNYNAVTRNNEEALFPLLRKLNISFYAYSPLAGGLFAKSIDELKNPKEGSRFHPNSGAGPMYRRMYINDTFLNAIEKFQLLCKEEDIKPSQAAFRWLQHHSELKENDAIILGASNVAQLEENVADSDGPKLSEKLLKGLSDMWDGVADKAPNYHM
ncbi:aflatoxin B1 aldehyde reductase [Acrasis kona]|uniref:Aflatoxin B1 aldehyde reductase n=1 Tax=Acrasis kona TaxID=1008807 RepID=A0AAW2ZC67_9EUKA